MRLIPLFIIIPLASAFLIALLGRRIKSLGDWLVNLTALSLLVFSLLSLKLVAVSKIILFQAQGVLPTLGNCFILDGLSLFMLVTVSLVSLMILIYSVSYMQRYSDKWIFHSLFMLMLAGINGVVLSGDLFTLYVFLELASFSAYALVAFGAQPEDLEASFKYAIMGGLASIFILLGIALLYSYTSTLNMADMSLALADKPAGILLKFVAVLFLVGFGLKSAIVPFHAWLPDAHSSAPSPVSAALSGLLIKALGVYALARVLFNVMGVYPQAYFIFLVLGIISMATGAVLAIAQDDIKRMFAYSSISQAGYILFAFGIGTPLAVLGGLLHLFNHAVFKSLLFLNAGAIEYSTGTRSLKRLGGLNSKLPITGSTALIGAMGISGIPPFGGFWSKLLIILAAAQAGYFIFAAVAALVSIITLVYYLKFQNFAFFGQLEPIWSKVKEVPFFMRFSLIILAVICLISGLLLLPAFAPFLQDAANILVMR
ncbi:MAG: proton-conducting transporter membrane subunit [Candidatus Omnitrophota bacterium]